MVKKYIFSADVVRSVAILAVMGIHLVTPITSRPDFFGGGFWWVTFLLNALFRVSVPLFIMLSGYLSLGKSSTIKENFERVSKRLVVPLVAYYIINVITYSTMAWLREEPYDYWSILHNLSKNTHSPLYFLVVLALVQLLNPLWNILTRKENLEVLQYVTKFFFSLAILAHFFYFVSLREGEVFSTFTLWIMWIGYYLYGYLVKLQPATLSQSEQKKYALLYILGYVFTVGFGYFNLWLHYVHNNNVFLIGDQTYVDTYLSISVVMMSIGLFNLLMRTDAVDKLKDNQLLQKTVAFLAGLSFALYLNHLLVIDILNKFFGVTADSPAMPGLPGYLVINTVLTFALSIPLALLIKKTTGLKQIVGEK